MCKDLKGVVNNVQKKLHDKSNNSSLDDVLEGSNNSITCPVQELQQTVNFPTIIFKLYINKRL